MKTQWGSFSRAQQCVLKRISNRLIQDAKTCHRQDFNLLASREVTAVLNDLREHIERRRRLRPPALLESSATA